MDSLRPRLCIVAHSAELYGADRCLHAALPELVAHFDVTVAVPADGDGVGIMRALGAEVLLLPDYALRRRHLTPRGVFPWLARVRSATSTLKEAHRDRPFTLVYSNTLAAGIGPLLRKSFGVAHAVHVHECPNEPAWLPRVLLAMLAHGADLAICNSYYSANWVNSNRPDFAAKTVVVHNGLDLVAAPLHPPTRGTALTLSCVARIHPKKGHPVLFEAMRLAHLDGRKWVLHLFGDTLDEHIPIRDELVSFSERHGFAQSVVWHGFVDNVQRQYESADIAIVPSVIPEEFSLVCLEAQSMMVPVIATGPGGASEVVDDGVTGIIVAPNDAAALFEAICSIEDDVGAAHEMGRQGRERAELKFSRQAFAHGVVDQLVSLAASPSPTTTEHARATAAER